MENQNRRKFINSVGLLTGAFLFNNQLLIGLEKQERYKIAVIDLMILKRQKISALPLAKEVGADGLEIDMGGLGNRDTFDNKLADAAIRQDYLNQAKALNLQICSLAMTGFYAQSFATRPTYQKNDSGLFGYCEGNAGESCFFAAGSPGRSSQKSRTAGSDYPKAQAGRETGG